jgi:hypothetical protein
VAGRVDPPVALVDDDPQARIVVGRLEAGDRPVAGGVVDDDHLEVLESLRQAAVNGAADDLLAVVRRHDNGEEGGGHAAASLTDGTGGAMHASNLRCVA